MSVYKDKMREAIIEAAQDLFLENSISGVTISDVAKKAGVGEATVYRYFKTKQNLALQVALKEWGNVFLSFRNEMEGDGFRRLSLFYSMFLTTFRKHRDFFAFLFEFDQMVSANETPDLGGYQKSLLEIKGLYEEAYEIGLKDHSVKPAPDKDLFYYSTTHSLLSLCKQLSYDNPIDRGIKVSKEKEIKTLVDLIIAQLKGETK